MIIICLGNKVFVVVTGMTFLMRAAIKISRNLSLLELSCLNERIIVIKCSELRLK